MEINKRDSASFSPGTDKGMAGAAGNSAADRFSGRGTVDRIYGIF